MSEIEQLKVPPTKRERGDWGEEQAQRWLRARGFLVLQKHWRPPRGEGGEVDLVARRRREVWMIEVKTRSTQAGAEVGGPIELLGAAQRERFYRSRGWIRERFCRQGETLRMALIWVDSGTGAVEFLENP